MKTLLFKESYNVVYLSIMLIYISYIFKSQKTMYLTLILLSFLIYFYRFPYRKNYNEGIISPCDGTIKEIIYNENGTKDIIIFLSVFDVHVQWAPVEGEIIDIKYKNGDFNPAFLLKHSEKNERNIVSIKNKNGIVHVKQIAGIIARRIVCWLKKNDIVEKGQPYGMIKLSSRVDINIPSNTLLRVKENDKVEGNLTVLADWL